MNPSNIRHKFTSLESRIALQVARKIAPCERAFSKIEISFQYYVLYNELVIISNVYVSWCYV